MPEIHGKEVLVVVSMNIHLTRQTTTLAFLMIVSRMKVVIAGNRKASVKWGGFDD